MSETRRQGDEFLGSRKGLRFRSAFPFVVENADAKRAHIYAIGEDGLMYEATWSEAPPDRAEIEGWRPVKMDVWEEEYVDS